MDESLTGDQLDWQEKTPIEIAAIGRNRIDLVSAVGSHDPSSRCEALTSHSHNDDVLRKSCPLALNSEEPSPYHEREVIAAVLGHRREDRNAKFGRSRSDLSSAIDPLWFVE
jgi:hypothetical protein